MCGGILQTTSSVGETAGGLVAYMRYQHGDKLGGRSQPRQPPLPRPLVPLLLDNVAVAVLYIANDLYLYRTMVRQYDNRMTMVIRMICPKIFDLSPPLINAC